MLNTIGRNLVSSESTLVANNDANTQRAPIVTVALVARKKKRGGRGRGGGRDIPSSTSPLPCRVIYRDEFIVLYAEVTSLRSVLKFLRPPSARKRSVPPIRFLRHSRSYRCRFKANARVLVKRRLIRDPNPSACRSTGDLKSAVQRDGRFCCLRSNEMLDSAILMNAARDDFSFP